MYSLIIDENDGAKRRPGNLANSLIYSIFLLVAIFSVSLLVSCARLTVKSRVDRDLENKKSIEQRTDLDAYCRSAVDLAGGLSETQKTEIKTIAQSASDKMNALYKDELRLRALLMEKVLSKAPDDDQVDAIQSRMKSIEAEKRSVISEEIDQVARSLKGESTGSRERNLAREP
jgi:hypothetical protein